MNYKVFFSSMVSWLEFKGEKNPTMLAFTGIGFSVNYMQETGNNSSAWGGKLKFFLYWAFLHWISFQYHVLFTDINKNNLKTNII